MRNFLIDVDINGEYTSTIEVSGNTIDISQVRNRTIVVDDVVIKTSGFIENVTEVFIVEGKEEHEYLHNYKTK